MTKALILAACLTATAAHAGGPIVIEDENPVVVAGTEDGRMPGWVVPVGIGLILIALVAGGDTCNSEPEQPSTTGGC